MRLFIAVNPPDSLRNEIVRASAALRDAGFPIRWVDGPGIHLTMKFLGEVGEQDEAAVSDALSDACRGVTAFPLSISGFGAFPNLRRPTVVWVGCDPSPTLERVHGAIERSLATVGFEPERRPFRPHLTLGRVRRDAGRLAGFGAAVEPLRFEDTFTVEAIDLMQSTLGRAGAHYTMRHSVPLTPA